MLDLEREHAELAEPLRLAYERVVASGRFILGEEVERFEAEAARWLGTRFAIGVSSGTDALLCALTALGVGAGDEVITSAFSFVATGEAIVRTGARPRFVDVDPTTLNLDLDRVESAIGPRTRAIVPVHLYGEPVPMDELAVLAERRGVAVVEDAAQAFGAVDRGARVGTRGRAGCFSFFPSKPLGALGDGGLIATSDAALAERCRALRSHGRSADRAQFETVGGNFRLDALQAAFLRVKLPHVEVLRERRAHHVRAYTEAFRSLDGIRVPFGVDREGRIGSSTRSAWALYTLRVPARRRDELVTFLADRGIDTAVHYRVPLHRQPALAAARVGTEQLPHAEAAAREVISLPLFPSLTRTERMRVIDAVRAFFETPKSRDIAPAQHVPT